MLLFVYNNTIQRKALMYPLQLCSAPPHFDSRQLLRFPIWDRSVSIKLGNCPNWSVRIQEKKLLRVTITVSQEYTANKIPWFQINVEPFEIKMKKCSLVGARSKMNNMQ